MTDKEFKQLMASVKDAPEFGGDADGARAQTGWNTICRDIGFEQAPAAPYVYGLGAYADFCLHTTCKKTIKAF